MQGYTETWCWQVVEYNQLLHSFSQIPAISLNVSEKKYLF